MPHRQVRARLLYLIQGAGILQMKTIAAVALTLSAGTLLGADLTDTAEAEGNAPTRELGTVTVVGRRPSSLPMQIPTTI